MFKITHPTTKVVIEIAENDLEPMTWEDADNACNSLGEGWRLPTTLELDTMCKNLHASGEGDFSNSNYWSGTTSTLFKKMGAYNFERASPFADFIGEKYFVRPVREV